MFKAFVTLMRGATHDAAEEFTDRHALLILQQQMREATQAVTTARKAVALAVAQNAQEAKQHEVLVMRLRDLEARTISAMEQEKEDLAREAAEAIAALEAERDVSEKAQAQFASEIRRLKSHVRTAEIRLRDLQRGQRLAAATDKAQRLHEQVPSDGLSILDEAEQTLARLRTRQTQIDLTALAIQEMDVTSTPDKVLERLAEAGCGAPIRPSADDVLARLSKKVRKKS
ncbi:MAG: PspA/IM30 family protein [Pseudomonadota bacterium]